MWRNEQVFNQRAQRRLVMAAAGEERGRKGRAALTDGKAGSGSTKSSQRTHSYFQGLGEREALLAVFRGSLVSAAE